MLKSTYKPSATALAPLPPGWTEHKAPTGHTYYYNEATQTSTYTRPGGSSSPAAHVPPQEGDPTANLIQYSALPNLSNPATANAFLALRNAQAQTQQPRGGYGFDRGGRQGGDRPRPRPHDRPRSKVVIPGCDPWILVYTKYGRRFVYNPVKNASYWRIPEKVMKGVLELDIQGVTEKVARHNQEPDSKKTEPSSQQAEAQRKEEASSEVLEELGSDYEEVEVTDDEGEGEKSPEGNEEHPSKRQRTEEPSGQEASAPVEFTEEDIAAQLQALGQDYDDGAGEYADDDEDAWAEGAEGHPMSDEEARQLFKDLLTDYGINPYSPWDKLIEDAKVMDDPRYTILPTTKARREVWEEWSREQIKVLKDRRAKEEIRDPRIPYMAFLAEKCNPKLYWPEFKRKYKKEAPMRDLSLSDKDREKYYREYVGRLRLPQDTLKKDLTVLLKSIPAKHLNNKTLLESLPSQVIADVRYNSLHAKVRDPMIEAYLSTLGPPPEEGETDEDETARKARDDRRRRENALRERERVVAEEKRRQQKQLEYGRAALRAEQRELESAMQVGKKGLQSQLFAEREKVLPTQHTETSKDGGVGACG